MAVGLQISSMLTDWSSPLLCPLIIRPTQRYWEEPCLSVMEDSCLDAAVSNGLQGNLIPEEERRSNDGNALRYKPLAKLPFYIRHLHWWYEGTLVYQLHLPKKSYTVSNDNRTSLMMCEHKVRDHNLKLYFLKMVVNNHPRDGNQDLSRNGEERNKDLYNDRLHFTPCDNTTLNSTEELFLLDPSTGGAKCKPVLWELWKWFSIFALQGNEHRPHCFIEIAPLCADSDTVCSSYSYWDQTYSWEALRFCAAFYQPLCLCGSQFKRLHSWGFGGPGLV